MKKSTDEFQKLASILDGTLEKREYVTGALSVADFSIAAMMDLATRADLGLDTCPHVARWLESIHGRESWKLSAPKV